MKRILIAALAAVGLGAGSAVAQSFGSSDVGSTPGVPSNSSGADTSTGTGDQTDSDQPVGHDNTGTMNDQNDMPNMPGTGRSGSELPDLGTPDRNLGEPDTSSSDTRTPDQTATPNVQPPTNDEGSATLPEPPNNVPDVNR